MESVAIKTKTFLSREIVINSYLEKDYRIMNDYNDDDLAVFVIPSVKTLLIRSNRVADENAGEGYTVKTYEEWLSM